MIKLLEALSAKAHATEVVQTLDGWQLRYTGSNIRRANSVYPMLSNHQRPLQEKVTLVEKFYTARNSASCFQLSPAMQIHVLEEFLLSRGYQKVEKTLVKTAELAMLKIADPISYRPIQGLNVNLDWFTKQEMIIKNRLPLRIGILKDLRPTTIFAQLSDGKQTISHGLGIVEQGWLGLYNLWTKPESRRQRAATTIVHALVNAAAKFKANQSYLHVDANNRLASTFYAKLGFKTKYSYHFCEREIA